MTAWMPSDAEIEASVELVRTRVMDKIRKELMDTEMVRLLALNAYIVYRCCMVGSPSPSVRRLYERITHPRIGDLVLEVSRLGYEPADQLGWLQEVHERREGISYTITTLDMRPVTWVNAQMIGVCSQYEEGEHVLSANRIGFPR
jgi:hypothetical protein